MMAKHKVVYIPIRFVEYPATKDDFFGFSCDLCSKRKRGPRYVNRSLKLEACSRCMKRLRKKMLIEEVD